MVECEARSIRIRLREKTLLKRKFSEAMPENTELVVPDSLAGSSGDAVTNLVGNVHLTESTIQQYMRAANDISHEATSSITHTLVDKQVSNTLQSPAAKQQNSWRL